MLCCSKDNFWKSREPIKVVGNIFIGKGILSLKDVFLGGYELYIELKIYIWGGAKGYKIYIDFKILKYKF